MNLYGVLPPYLTYDLREESKERRKEERWKKEQAEAGEVKKNTAVKVLGVLPSNFTYL